MEIDELSGKIREATKEVLSHKETTKTTLEASLEELEFQESMVDFEGPRKIKQEVLSSLSKMSMFLVENPNDLRIEHIEEEGV